MEPHEERELRVGDGPAVGAHEVRELVGCPREARRGEQRRREVRGAALIPRS